MTDAWFRELLARYPRIAIAGGPRVGKTTLTGVVTDRPVIHTDDTMDQAWEDQPFIAVERCKPHPRFVVEGVQVARALRKGLVVDVIIWVAEPLVPRTPKQEALAKGVLSVFAGWRAQNQQIPIVQPTPAQVRAVGAPHA